LRVNRPALILAFLLIASFSASAQGANPSCWTNLKSDVIGSVKTMGAGYQATPSRMVAKRNLKWELPIAAATAVLIGAVDTPAARHMPSPGVVSGADTASNVLLGLEVGAPAVAYIDGCARHSDPVRQFGFNGLAGIGFASLNAAAMKVAFNRQRPYVNNANGEFWEGGNSFPSGHAAASFGLASALTARYPHRPVLKWTLFVVASSASLLRFPARQHFPSDILVGGTIGYVSGRYLGEKLPGQP
jgi:hypothetical protein